MPAFGLRVSPTGNKTFVVRYLAEGGGRGAPQRQKTLGSFATFSPSDARRMARDVLATVRCGGDPLAELKARRAAMTMEAAVNFYEEEGCFIQRGARQGEPMKPLTKAYTLARLRHHVVPLLGKRRASEITEGDIETFSRAVANGKTARDEKVGSKRIIVRGGLGAARKVIQDLSAVFSFLKRHRVVVMNPVQDARVRKTDNKRDRFLSIAEVQRLGEALTMLEAEGANAKALNIVRCWALTGCRRNEIASLKKSEIELERGLLVFDDTKTGRSVRPLGTAAVALFRAVLAQAKKDQCKSEYLFPAEHGKSFYQGTKKIWSRAIELAKLPGVTPHTLRHTVGGLGGSSAESLLMIGAVLGHSNARSTTIYAHIAHDPARMAADRITTPIAEALGIAAPPE